jgi:hypothetical protein
MDCLDLEVRHSLTGIRFKKRQMACIKRIWDHRAWDLDLAEEPLLEGSEESLEEKNSTDVSSEDEGIQDDDEDEDEGDQGGEWDQGKGKGQGGKADIEENETEADENEAEDPTWTGPKDDELGVAVSKLLEFIFELNIMFITNEFTNGQPCSNPLVYFSGILGFSADARSFQPAKQVTPYLSGLIYVQRLLFLRYALQFRAYKHLGIARRPRRKHLERLDEIRLWYMTAGSPTPLGKFQSLWDFGRAISRPTRLLFPSVGVTMGRQSPSVIEILRWPTSDAYANTFSSRLSLSVGI